MSPSILPLPATDHAGVQVCAYSPYSWRSPGFKNRLCATSQRVIGDWDAIWCTYNGILRSPVECTAIVLRLLSVCALCRKSKIVSALQILNYFFYWSERGMFNHTMRRGRAISAKH